MKNRFVIVAVSALTALVAGGLTAYWVLNQRLLGSGDLPVGATAIPQDTLMTLSVSTDENQWSRLQRLGTADSRARLTKFVNEWRDRLLTVNDLTYDDDIKPWIGDEITIALMGPTPLAVPPSPGSSGGSPDDASANDDQPASASSSSSLTLPTPRLNTPPLDVDPDLIDPTQKQVAVLFIPIDNPIEAQQRLTRALESGTSPTEREYRGITIHTFQQGGEETYEAAVFDRKLLAIATQPMVLDTVIDTYKGDPSIVDTPGYDDAVRTVSAAQPFAQVYVNAEAARAIANANATDSARSRNLVPLQNMQGFAATATLNSDGVRLRGTSWLLPDSQPLRAKNQPRHRLAEHLPDSTLMAVSGSNLKALWDGYSERTANVADGPFAPKNLRTATETVLGVDLEEDVMAWMGGEFVLALASTTHSANSMPSAGLVFLVQTSDRQLAQQTLSQLDETVESRYRFQVTDTQLGGQDVVNWQSPFAAITITRGWLNDGVAFLGFNNVTKTMVPRPTNSLAALDIFQKATASQPNAHTGYFFINMEQFLQARSHLPVPNVPDNQAAFVDAIRAIGVTTSVGGDRQLHYDISVVTQTDDSVN